MSTDGTRATHADSKQAIRTIQSLAIVNLGLVALEAISAGSILSGHGYGVAIHRVAAIALQIGALVQAFVSVVIGWRYPIPRWVMGVSVGLLVFVLMQAGLGRSKSFWLHVPAGVGLFAALTRQVARLHALRHEVDPLKEEAS